jgi:subtilisin family serine protease
MFQRAARCLAIAAISVVVCVPAVAQLRGLPLPNLPPQLPDTLERPVQRLLQPPLAPTDLLGLRRALVDELLAREPRRLERDPQGHPMLRGEVVLSSPPVALLDAAQAAGFRVARDERLPALDLYLVVLQAPAGLDTAAALARLRALAPDAAQDFNHLYLPAGQLAAGGPAPAAPAPAAAPSPAGARVGLVDGGVDTRHASLRDAPVRRHGCAAPAPDRHGTAVASLLVGRAAGFQGALPGAALYAADIYCGSAANGSLDAVLRALAWMAQQQVPVVNLSVVGPPNRLLERAVQAMAARGHVLVAAVGNDGPAAPPLYPAAYPGVVGVTGVDERQRVLPEAAQGPMVALAAPGADLAVAAMGDRPYTVARGTSFAAPLVAGLLARSLTTPDQSAASTAIARLSHDALDLGAPGRDSVYGHGLVAQALRVEPSRVRATP